MKTRLFLTVAAVIAMTAIAAAQTEQPATGQTGRGQAADNAYVDANKDGVCDNYTNGTRPGRRAYSAGISQEAANRGPGIGKGQRKAGAFGRGQGMAAGTGQGRGQGRINGRGQGRGQGMAAGTGQGRGQGRINGRGPAFVDANNDGVCDNLATTTPEK